MNLALAETKKIFDRAISHVREVPRPPLGVDAAAVLKSMLEDPKTQIRSGYRAAIEMMIENS